VVSSGIAAAGCLATDCCAANRCCSATAATEEHSVHGCQRCFAAFGVQLLLLWVSSDDWRCKSCWQTHGSAVRREQQQLLLPCYCCCNHQTNQGEVEANNGNYAYVFMPTNGNYGKMRRSKRDRNDTMDAGPQVEPVPMSEDLSSSINTQAKPCKGVECTFDTQSCCTPLVMRV
jgi:hypothetical protein